VRNLDIKTLRLFVAVCDCGNLKAAAVREHIEPSAISKRIAQLEDVVGTTVLVRGRHGAVPTVAGRALLEHARSILFTLDRIEADMAAFKGGIKGQVSVVASASAIAESLLDDLAHFMRDPEHADIKVDIEEPLAAHEAVRFEDTLDFEHVGLPPSTAVYSMLDRAAAKAGRRMSYRVVVSNFDAAFRVVGAGLGISVVPREVSGIYVSAGQVRLVPLLNGWAQRQFAICFRKQHELTPAADRLLAFLQQQAGP